MARRSSAEIRAEYQRLHDKVWFNRHYARPLPENPHWQKGEEYAQALRDRYGEEFLDPGDDFAWGETMGKFQALAWALGVDWEAAGDT